MKYIIAILMLVFLAGCITPPEEPILNDTNQSDIQPDIIPPEDDGKIPLRIRELIEKARQPESFEYDYYTSDQGFVGRFYIINKDAKVVFPELKIRASGENFDEVYFDRSWDKAWSYCSKDHCNDPKDFTAECVDFPEYYEDYPRQWLLDIKSADILGEEMIGKYNTLVINFTGRHDYSGKMWLQSYYGIPLQIEYSDIDRINRTIEFRNMTWNTVPSIRVRMPFNVSKVCD